MILGIKRLLYGYNAILSNLSIDGSHRFGIIENLEKAIPEGMYPIDLRHDSPLADKYRKKYKLDGMIWLRGVPDREYIYIHVGNYVTDLEGCLAVGRSIFMQPGICMVQSSRTAYEELHNLVSYAIGKGEKVTAIVA